MGTVEKHGPTWRARWIDENEKRVSKSGFHTKKDAQRFLKDRERELQRLGVRIGMTFDELVDEYLGMHRASARRLEKLEDLLTGLPFGGKRLVDLRSIDVARWQADQTKPHTLHDGTTAIKQVLKHAVVMGFLEKSPAEHIKSSAPPPPEVLPFADWDEVARLDQHLGGLAAVAVGTGMRPQEWSRLRWEHIDLHGRVIILPASISKTKQARRIPIRVRVMDALIQLPSRSGLVFSIGDMHNWRKRVWAPALKACGLEYRRPYEMRHTYATWALRAGVSTFLVARRMGTSVRMIDRTYGQFAVDTEEHELRLLDAYDGAVVGHREPTLGGLVPTHTFL